MSGHGYVLAAFTDGLHAESASLFIMHRRERLWFEWGHAQQFAFFESLVQHRKQSVSGRLIDGRWLWHVQTIPVPLTGDGAGAPPAVGGDPAGEAMSTLAPSSHSPRCAYRQVAA